ncbi:hypothetical protein BP6252_11918 [Coleophoma cylindrospora]|uniref:Zn(2)-C6 fungal-type domain-containing protein n=1 Tax=Coleophoma cylindrospora TaxID=1849047 RepID=A0A3D8QFD2_9HELO|nr:hypothetical protein BP6252_11918 [Coleophoma cylindrospora]
MHFESYLTGTATPSSNCTFVSEMNQNKRPRVDPDAAAFDDHHPSSKPQLTRACVECKKHKIKCLVQPGQEACNKCLKSGIRCVPHSLAQKFIDKDTDWKSHATSTMEQLKCAVGDLLQHNNLSDLSSYHVSTAICLRPAEAPAGPMFLSTMNHANVRTIGNFMSEGPSTQQQENDSNLVPLPMNNLYSPTEPGNSRLIRVDPSLL